MMERSWRRLTSCRARSGFRYADHGAVDFFHEGLDKASDVRGEVNVVCSLFAHAFCHFTHQVEGLADCTFVVAKTEELEAVSRICKVEG